MLRITIICLMLVIVTFGSCRKVNNNVFYEGYTNTKYGHNYLYFKKGVKSAHQKYFDVHLINGQLVRGVRKYDTMRNNKQYFDNEGKLTKFQSLDTIDRVVETIEISYDNAGRQVQQVSVQENSKRIDSVFFEYSRNSRLKRTRCHYSNIGHICGNGKSILYKDFESEGNVVKMQRKCQDSLVVLLDAAIYVFNRKGYLVQKSDLYDEETGNITTYEYDTKGRLLNERMTATNSSGFYNIYEHYGDTLTVVKNFYLNDTLNYIAKYVSSLDKMGNLLKVVRYTGDEPNYLIEFDLEHY